MIANPIDDVAGIVVGAAADGFKGMLLSVWAAGVAVLRWSLTTMDLFTVPDISTDGPAKDVYGTALWTAGALMLLLAMAQFAVAVIRRDGRSLGQVAIGTAGFVVVWAGWVVYAGALLLAVHGIDQALMKSLFGVDAWESWDPFDGETIGESVTEVSTAMVLAFLGCFLFLAAIGQFAVMLGRSAALLILAVVTPLTAAGLVTDFGKAWFWKSVRWFHAAAFIPILMTLITGVGLKLAQETAKGATDGGTQVIATAAPAVVLILMSLVAPTVLFRLLAFTDPGTSSGAAMRSGMAAHGGVAGLIAGRRHETTDSAAASTATDTGVSQGEAQATEATTLRHARAERSRVAAIRARTAATVGKVAAAGSQATVITVDALNQSSVGDGSYYPDYYTRPGARFGRGAKQPPNLPPPMVVDERRQPDPPPTPAPPPQPTHENSEES